MDSITAQENLLGKDDLQKPGRLIQLISFTVGNDTFGVDILMVHEVIRSAKFTSVPNSSDFIEGIINLRGNIFPVIDLRKKLHLYSGETPRENTWIIILEVQEIMTGFIVDKVLKALKVDPSAIEREPDIADDRLHKRYISGIGNIDGERITLLDFNQILLGIQCP